MPVRHISQCIYPGYHRYLSHGVTEEAIPELSYGPLTRGLLTGFRCHREPSRAVYRYPMLAGAEMLWPAYVAIAEVNQIRGQSIFVAFEMP